MSLSRTRIQRHICVWCRPESARQSLCAQAHGGKSGLHRARCQVTPGRREPTESATERYRLSAAKAAPVRVKWCGKSAPRWWQHQWHGKPHLKQDQIGKQEAAFGRSVWPTHWLPGRSLELRGDAYSRGMTAHDRTRLIGRLRFCLFRCIEPDCQAASKLR